MGHKKGDFPVSEQTSERLLSLPMFPELTQPQVERVAEAVKESVSLAVPD